MQAQSKLSLAELQNKGQKVLAGQSNRKLTPSEIKISISSFLNQNFLKIILQFKDSSTSILTFEPMIIFNFFSYFYLPFVSQPTESSPLNSDFAQSYAVSPSQSYGQQNYSNEGIFHTKAQRTQKLIALPSESGEKQLNISNFKRQKEQKKKAKIYEDMNEAFTEKRNIIPNNINHILAFVQRKSKSEKLVTLAIEKYAGEGCSKYTSKRFYAYQAYIKGKIDIQVCKKTLLTVTTNLDLHSDIFPVTEQLFYNKICRIVIASYLQSISALTTLNSRRLRSTCKNSHLRAQRRLLTFLKDKQNIENFQQ